MVRQYIGARYTIKVYENSLDPSSAEWEASTAYEPLVLVTYNNSSYLSKKQVPNTVGDPAANPSYWVVTGAYNGQIAYLQDEIDVLNGAVVTPEMYGAVGDGVADDSDAVQQAFTNGTNVVMHGKYYVTKTLYLDGQHNIIGGGTIIADLPEVDPNEYLLVLGATSMGVAGNVFTGTIENIRFVILGGNYDYVIGGCNAQNATIRDCFFDLTAANCHNKVIAFVNNASVAMNNSNSRDYLIDNNTIIYEADPNDSKNMCESIGVAVRKGVTISNNLMFNCKDDSPGVHGCKDVNICNNFIYSYSARIYVSNSSDVDIYANSIHVEPDINCQGIQCEQEDGSSYTVYPHENINIVDNIVDYRGTTTTNIQTGIRVQAAKKVLIEGNKLLTDNLYQGYLSYENETVNGVQTYVEDVEICNNQVTAIIHGLNGAASTDPIGQCLIHDNVIEKRFSASSAYDIHHGNLFKATSFVSDSYEVLNLADRTEYNLACVFSGTGSNTEQPALINGMPKLVIQNYGYLDHHFRFTMDNVIPLGSSDFYQFKIYKNGTLLTTIGKHTEDADASGISASDRYCEPGDVITVTYRISGTVPSPQPAITVLQLLWTPFTNC